MSKLIHQNASRVYLSIDQSDLEPFDNQWANDDHHPLAVVEKSYLDSRRIVERAKHAD